MSSNLDVLIGEDKAQVRFSLSYIHPLPNWVYATATLEVVQESYLPDHSHQWWKAAFCACNLRQLVYLILMWSFEAEDPKVTAIFHDLYRKCPILFETELTKWVMYSLHLTSCENKDEDVFALRSDDRYETVTAIGSAVGYTIQASCNSET